MRSDISHARFQPPAANSATMKPSQAPSAATEPGSAAFVVPGAMPPEQPTGTTRPPEQPATEGRAQPGGPIRSPLLDLALAASVALDMPAAPHGGEQVVEQPGGQDEEDPPAADLLARVLPSVAEPVESGVFDDGEGAPATDDPASPPAKGADATAEHVGAPSVPAPSAAGHRARAEPKRGTEANVEEVAAPGDEKLPGDAAPALSGMVAPPPGADEQDGPRSSTISAGRSVASAEEHAPQGSALQPKDEAALRPASTSPSPSAPATPRTAAGEAGEKPSPLSASSPLPASSQLPTPDDPSVPAAAPTLAPATATPAPQASTVVQNVPLGAVAVEIGLKSLAGVNRFQIRLDPPELGRIDVRLDIGEDGTVKARLSVDRVETLALLQRDARTLERAFEQAGLKPSDSGVDLSLRDQGRESGREHQRGEPRDERDGTSSELDAQMNQLDLTALSRATSRQIWRGATGVDVRI